MQKSEAAQEVFMKTERLRTFSAAKTTKNLYNLVGAGLCARPRTEIRIQRLEVRNGAGSFYENRKIAHFFGYEKQRKIRTVL